MEETKKRTRKTAAVKEEKMAKKAPAAAVKQQYLEICMNLEMKLKELISK